MVQASLSGVKLTLRVVRITEPEASPSLDDYFSVSDLRQFGEASVNSAGLTKIPASTRSLHQSVMIRKFDLGI